MTINLQKKQAIRLEKKSKHPNQLKVEFGRKVRKKGLIAGLAGGKNEYNPYARWRGRWEPLF